MRLINVETLKLVNFSDKDIPNYAILSHTWGADEDEVSFDDIETGTMEKARNGLMKLKGCCKQAKKDGFEYVWIDTCCIDKTNSVELGEAINSMFRWYKEASVCYVYLCDVSYEDNENSGDFESEFSSSRWFRRGWTLQELLAPQELQFYDRTWALIGTKREMAGDIERITGIPRRFLRGVNLDEASIAQRMSWAAKRETRRQEDIAYCLLGIFNVTMPMIYGERDNAFIRLQEEIMKKSRDDSILAWGLGSEVRKPTGATGILSAGILACAPSDFANCGNISLRKQDVRSAIQFRIDGGYLRVLLSLHTTSDGEMYGLLNCGSEHGTEVVGIPLCQDESDSPSKEYLRPQGYNPTLLSKTALSVPTETIHIRVERQKKVAQAIDRRYWFDVEGYKNIKLTLVDNYPPDDWKRGFSRIEKGNDSEENILRRYLARFRSQDEQSRYFVVILEVEIQGLCIQSRCHVMTSSRDITLKDLSQRLIYMRPEALGKQMASNGNLDIEATVEQQEGQEPNFVVKLARASGVPEVNVDADQELRPVELTFELIKILQDEEQIEKEAERLDKQRIEERATLRSLNDRLDEVKENLRRLREEEKSLIDGLKEGIEREDQLAKWNIELGQQQRELSDRKSDTNERLNEIEMSQRPENWLEAIIKKHLSIGQSGHRVESYDSNLLQLSKTVEKGPDIDEETPLSWVAANGHEAVARLLIERGADIEAKDTKNNWTPLRNAVAYGHESIVRLLIEKGANIETKGIKGETPLRGAVLQGHIAIVRLLIEAGANIESKDNNNWSALNIAAYSGHEAIVRLLIERGADIESKQKNGYTPLRGAVLQGHIAIVRLLIEAGANIESKDDNNWSPLNVAAYSGHEAIARLLIERGADIESKQKNGYTPLRSAANNGQAAMVQLLLEKGVDIESTDTDGWTSLNAVAHNGYEKVARLLIERGADIESKQKNGYTPLRSAANNGQAAMVQLLLEKGADIESTDTDGWTSLNAVAHNGYEKVARLLIDAGADIESKNDKGWTPLNIAAYNGREAIVRLLIDAGADVESKSNSGHTPVRSAAATGHEAIAQLLLEKGARNPSSLVPRDIANKHKTKLIVNSR